MRYVEGGEDPREPLALFRLARATTSRAATMFLPVPAASKTRDRPLMIVVTS